MKGTTPVWGERPGHGGGRDEAAVADAEHPPRVTPAPGTRREGVQPERGLIPLGCASGSAGTPRPPALPSRPCRSSRPAAVPLTCPPAGAPPPPFLAGAPAAFPHFATGPVATWRV